jgi:hypothetical protein
MDLLQANFPGLWPGVSSETRTNERKSETLPEKPPGSLSGKESLGAILGRLEKLRDDVYENAPDTKIEDIADSLDDEFRNLMALWKNPDLFETDQLRRRFFCRAGKWLRDIRRANELWSSFNAGVAAAEEKFRQSSAKNLSLVDTRRGAAPWATWCNSLRPALDNDTIHYAQKHGASFLARSQFLPRGGYALLGSRIIDTRDAVDGILEVSDSTMEGCFR